MISQKALTFIFTQVARQLKIWSTSARFLFKPVYNLPSCDDLCSFHLSRFTSEEVSCLPPLLIYYAMKFFCMNARIAFPTTCQRVFQDWQTDTYTTHLIQQFQGYQESAQPFLSAHINIQVIQALLLCLWVISIAMDYHLSGDSGWHSYYPLSYMLLLYHLLNFSQYYQLLLLLLYEYCSCYTSTWYSCLSREV